MISEELLHAGLETSFGAGDEDGLWLLRGDGERSDMRELLASVRPLISSSGSFSWSILITGTLMTEDLGAFLVLLIFVVGLATQMTLRQVERWNCTKWLQE